MEASEGPSTGDPSTPLSNQLNASRNRRNARDRTPRTTDVRSNTGADQHAPRRRYGQAKPAGDSPLASGPSTTESGAPAVTVNEDASRPPSRKRNPKSKNIPRPPNAVDAKDLSISIQVNSSSDGKTHDRPRPGGGGFKRGGKFNAGLTESDSALPPVSKPGEKYRSKPKPSQVPETLDDLTSRLTYALRTPPYPDCPICFSPIHPAQPIWSCSPSIPVIRPDDAESDEQQYCWTAFHVKCIGSWATKSVKNIADAWRARGEEGRRGDWRCPGCQAKREVVPSGYWCFCNSTPEPKPPRLATPHSCGNPCSRMRESGCGHPCPLACHPGPCPPCQVTTQSECYCPKKTLLAFRCGVDRGGPKRNGRDLTCGSVCGRTLGCRKHTCERVCHDGDCDACAIREVARCLCGKAEKEVSCGDGEAVVCFVENEEEWIGRFRCLDPCGRLFDCGSHKCQQSCHPPSCRPAPCPSSPSKITHCPCGKRPIRHSSTAATVLTAFPARSHCTSPIPTCTSSCDKLHASCGHPCGATCHTGPCPPCSFSMVRPCRCGGTTRTVRCYELRPPDGGDIDDEIMEILCEKPCAAVRTCGRHQCRRPCCPLASLASTTGKKGKKRPGAELDVGEEQGGLHECDLICGKVLSCGDHRCEEKDHKGTCPPCLRSSFEEMVCYCGRTVLEPPIPCGTQIRCKYQCSRPPPPCGHPRAQHSCHEGPSLCPPCPFLATKRCACGKKMVGNIRCSLETDKISCGTVCSKLMTCGFHHCERLCHGDVCGPCTAPCGKSRKLCLPAQHACTQACHAPSICPEDRPCHSLLTLACSCGRIRQAVHCGRNSSNTAGAQRTPPRCNNDCSIAQRNARLADALGITPGEKVTAVTYHEDLVTFAKADHKFLGLVEKAFVEFVNSNKKTQVLPHMPPERRQFVRSLAGVYRMDTEMVDQEPYRSVQLFRRLDTRIPTPLLSSAVVTPNAGSPSLGKLVDMRGSATTLWRGTSTPSLPKSLPTPSASGPTRGWSSAATQPMPVAMTPRHAPTPISRAVTHLPTSAHVSRTSTPTPSAPGVDTPDVNVPDDWEDDV